MMSGAPPARRPGAPGHRFPPDEACGRGRVGHTGGRARDRRASAAVQGGPYEEGPPVRTSSSPLVGLVIAASVVLVGCGAGAAAESLALPGAPASTAPSATAVPQPSPPATAACLFAVSGVSGTIAEVGADTGTETLTFTARHIHRSVDLSPDAIEKVTLPRVKVPAAFTSANLFIDSASDQWSYLRGATWQEAMTKRHVQPGETIDGCTIGTYARCPGANLSGLNLGDAGFTRANLQQGANLSNASLEHADFMEARLGSVDFTGANLSNAVVKASVPGWIITNADFSGAWRTTGAFCAAGSIGRCNFRAPAAPPIAPAPQRRGHGREAHVPGPDAPGSPSPGRRRVRRGSPSRRVCPPLTGPPAADGAARR